MPYAEFVEQVAYHQLYPWGDDWLQTGVVGAAAANSNPYRKTPARVEQFMPKVQKPMQTPQQQANVIMGFLNAMKQTGRLTEA